MKQALQHMVNELGMAMLTGFLGAAVAALAYAPGLSRRQQAVATIAGGMTAGFVSWGLQDFFHLSAGVAGGMSFFIGLVAFRATPALTKGLAAALEALPNYAGQVASAIAERIRTFGAPPAP